jgi:hypothetical protein
MHRGYEQTGYEPVRPHYGERTGGAGRLAPMSTQPAAQRAPVAAEVGSFFRDLRRNFRLSQPEAAHRLATHIDIIVALESGDVRRLPPWPETCRIVQTYTGFVGLDPRPILRLIEILQTSAGRTPIPAQDYGEERKGRYAAAVTTALRNAWEGQGGRTVRALVALSIPVALVVLVTQTSVLEAAVAKLPRPVARIVRDAQNYVIVQLSPVRDGLRWIDVPDPRSRRGDKLPTTARSD